MTQVGSAPAAGVAAPVAGVNFVEWGAVLAGALLAAAISFVLLTFGTAIGLSATSPWPNVGASTKLIASLAVLWVMMQQIGAFMVGGYVAGRMRTRWREPAEHEVEFRDGLLGGLVWAVGILIGAVLILLTAGAAAKTGIEIAGRSTSALAASQSEPMDVVLDAMLRPTAVAQAPSSSATPTPAATGTRPATISADARRELARVMTHAVATGGLSDQDRGYLVQVVAQSSGVSREDAEKRVNAAFNAAREAADKARKAAILTGLVTAASLIVSFGAAWWAAIRGGQHRDNRVPARFVLARGSRFNVPAN
ncbi:MAG TPA: hypothetical protein VKF35_00525 [Hyphomicrobiaceae bacterium]|nr:hypothetical protein [Hyphomicrobiaceae bacterium]